MKTPTAIAVMLLVGCQNEVSQPQVVVNSCDTLVEIESIIDTCICEAFTTPLLLEVNEYKKFVDSVLQLNQIRLTPSDTIYEQTPKSYPYFVIGFEKVEGDTVLSFHAEWLVSSRDSSALLTCCLDNSLVILFDQNNYGINYYNDILLDSTLVKPESWQFGCARGALSWRYIVTNDTLVRVLE